MDTKNELFEANQELFGIAHLMSQYRQETIGDRDDEGIQAIGRTIIKISNRLSEIYNELDTRED